MPAPPLLGASGAGDADVAVDVIQGNAGPTELELLGRGIHARDPFLEPAAGDGYSQKSDAIPGVCPYATPSATRKMTVFWGVS